MKRPAEAWQRSDWPNHNDNPAEIVMATNSLPQSTLDTFQPISATAVHVLARMAAPRAITEELRAQGVRVTLVKPAEISAKGQVYLSQHPELYREALERAQRMGMYEKPKRRSVT
jgi:hypothetical protein